MNFAFGFRRLKIDEEAPYPLIPRLNHAQKLAITN